MHPQICVPPSMQNIYERFHYAPAVRIGPWVTCAGQVGRDAEMRVVEDLEAQIVQAWENVRTVLASAGAGFEHVYAMTTYHAYPVSACTLLRGERPLHPAQKPTTGMDGCGCDRADFSGPGG